MAASLITNKLDTPAGSTQPNSSSSDQELTSNYINLSKDNADENKNPRIAVDEIGNIYAAWEDFTRDAILFSKSTDGGTTFSDPINLTSDSRGNHPQVSVSGNHVYVIWEKRYNMIALRTSADGGASFDNETVWGNESSADISKTKMLSVGNDLYILLFGSESEAKSLSFVRSTDFGNTFSEPIVLSDNLTVDTDTVPQMTADDRGNLYVAWFNGDIVLLKKSDNEGTSFTSSAIAPFNGAACTSDLKLSTALNNVYAICVFEGEELREGKIAGTHYNLEYRIIIYTQSSDSANNFNYTVSMTDKEHSDVYHQPFIFSSGHSVYIAYDDYGLNNTNKDIFLIRGFDNDTFYYPVDVSNDSADSAVAGLEASHNIIYLTWYNIPLQGNNDRYLLYSTSEDNGRLFSKSQVLGSKIPEYGQADFSLYNDSLFVVWTEGEESKNSIQFAKV